MANRQQILNPYNDMYNIHTHKHHQVVDIPFRCGHTESTFVEYCEIEMLNERITRLSKLLCVSCEQYQLSQIEEEYVV